MSVSDKYLEEYEKSINVRDFFEQTYVEPTKYKTPSINYIPRNTGSSNWILKGAIINEQVIIVCKDGRCKDDLRRKYHQMRRDFYYQLIGSAPPQSDRNWPMFITVAEYDTRIRGYRVPIVFDNSCFF